MKLTTTFGISLFLLILLNGCGTSEGDELLSEASLETKTGPMSCEDLLLKAEKLTGQTITVRAISWGSSPSIDGKEILMSLDDKKLEGMQQSHILVHFSKEQEREIQDFEENDQIHLSATVGPYEYGALRLLDPKILSKKK